MHEFFEHTADLGLRVTALDLNQLFAEAATGLVGMIVENLNAVQLTRTVEIRIVGTDREYLLFDWLNEVLSKFECDHLVLADFDVNVSGAGLIATCRGEPLDRERHQLGHEVKAITYHALTVEPTAEGWLAEVIVDI
jgi:SHS2 domain-containing protein